MGLAKEMNPKTGEIPQLGSVKNSKVDIAFDELAPKSEEMVWYIYLLFHNMF